MAWKERVISAQHFSGHGSVTVGTHPSCDVIVPLLGSNVTKVPLIEMESQVRILLHPGMKGQLVDDKGVRAFGQSSGMGGFSGQTVVLRQGELARIQLEGQVEIVVRYASQAPKPVLIPLLDFSSNGFLSVLLAIVLSVILSLWVALNKEDKLDNLDDEQFRTALIITNPPKPPPVKKKPPKKIKKIKKITKIKKKREKPKKKKKKKVVKVKKKILKKKVSKKKKVKPKVAKKRKNRLQPKRVQKKAVVAKKRTNKKRAKKRTIVKRGSSRPVKQGGAIKTGNKKGSSANSERKLKKSGIFSAFGSGGKNNRLDKSYSGSGGLAGLADQATGRSGFSEDRPGKGLGSKFKDTGAGGSGRSNVGVSRISRGGKGLVGKNQASLGGRKAVAIIPGGSGEEFSGRIDREGIRQVFFDNQRAIRSCYERELNRDARLGGSLKLNFDIGALGRVVGKPTINWGDSSLKSRSVAGCILNRLKTWRFPEPPTNQVVNVIYPLAFQAKR